MRETKAIRAGDLTAEIVPSLGAALTRFELSSESGAVPIFRPWPAGGTDEPTELACNLLVPWSNRISGGGFQFGGRVHALQPTYASDPFPLHGNGWVSAWTAVDDAPDRASLELISSGPGPFSYRARVDYRLSPEALTVTLSVANRAEISLPFGLGLHPWLPRTPETVLQAAVNAVWLEDERHLPTGRMPVRDLPDWDFSVPRPLPRTWINNGFDGWDRMARVEWPEHGVALEVEANDLFARYLLYSPSADAPFFCFEPVSHAVDAHNLPGGPAHNGLVVLEPGETISGECRFKPSRL